MDISSGSRKQHDASIQLNSQSLGNLRSTTVANHFPQSNNFSLIFTVTLNLMHPSCGTLKKAVASGKQKELTFNAHTGWLLFVGRTKYSFATQRQTAGASVYFDTSKKMKTFNSSPEKKTTALMWHCHWDLPPQYFNACYWNSNKFMTDCISLSYLKPLIFVSCRKEKYRYIIHDCEWFLLECQIRKSDFQWLGAQHILKSGCLEMFQTVPLIRK